MLPGAAAALAALLLAGALLLPADPHAGTRVFHIEAGQSFAQVEAHLAGEGFIARRGPLRLWARLAGKDRRIRPGAYELSAAQSPLKILQILAAGRVMLRRVTIPEGFTEAAILARLRAELALPVAELESALADTAWIRSLGIESGRLEGYLFPETYLFDPGIPPRQALGEMVRTFHERFNRRRQARAAEMGLSEHQALTLASIVEMETAVAEERPRIAAVYRNRLERGILLQADPTVAYAAGRIGRRLSLKDLEIDSPYNTYLHPGLPPGPICSPGLASIDAVLWPLVGCRDLYFVARGDGTHEFSRTLQEHDRARADLDRGR